MRWTQRPAHRQWLAREADDLLRFHERASLDPHGGFSTLDRAGNPLPDDTRELHATARMVHCFSAAMVLGRPGAAAIVDHGMRFLWERHRDAERGGYLWSVTADGQALDGRKQAYGHAFVLLAGASARQAGHPDADRLIADVEETILSRFWEEAHGAVVDGFAQDWTPLGPYRGQNANMHLAEALMALHEATGEARHLRMAERIAELIVDRHARAHGWRVIEHFSDGWMPEPEHQGDPIFRPYGTTPGHALEWSRLLLQLHRLGEGKPEWALEAAARLFAQAVADGWDRTRGGLVYTLDTQGRPHWPVRLWWPVCEGIAAAATLGAITRETLYEDWYRRFWDFAARWLIDREHGGWHPQIRDDGQPATEPFAGKPDIYHALQACLGPLLPAGKGLLAGLKAVSRS